MQNTKQNFEISSTSREIKFWKQLKENCLICLNFNLIFSCQNKTF